MHKALVGEDLVFQIRSAFYLKIKIAIFCRKFDVFGDNSLKGHMIDQVSYCTLSKGRNFRESKKSRKFWNEFSRMISFKIFREN